MTLSLAQAAAKEELREADEEDGDAFVELKQ
jgi:hypothetical protein